MSEEEYKFLLLRRLPVRLTVEQVTWLLNCSEEDVRVMMSAKLLKPLGKPAQNGTKYFATKVILTLADDVKSLDRITAATQQHWQGRNARKKKPGQLASGGLMPAVA